MAGLRPDDSPDPIDTKIVAALIDLAHALDLTVTAEGVETPQQAARLRALGCDTAQGWHYATPGTPEQVIALLDHEPAQPTTNGDRPRLRLKDIAVPTQPVAGTGRG